MQCGQLVDRDFHCGNASAAGPQLGIIHLARMQNLLAGASRLEGSLKSPSEPLTPSGDLEPPSPFANMSVVTTFWKGQIASSLLMHKSTRSR